MGSGVFLQGERIVLRTLLASDLEARYFEWFNDPEVCRHNGHHRFPYTRQQADLFFQGLQGSRDTLLLAVVHKEDDVHIGNISLQNIDPINRAAELALIFGEKSYWGQGFAGEAAGLIMRHGFQELNLHRIHCGTFAEHAAMRKLALSLGMREEGVRREAVFKGGGYHDMVVFGVLRHEFESHSQRRAEP